MEGILLPTKIEYKKGENERSADLVIEPLGHGYGTTIGNTLRRVLLTSLPGAAVTSVKIKGAAHEFMSIDGVYEDILEITLNLKLLRVKSHSDEPVKLTLKKKGAGEVSAKDFEKNADIEIVNPDLHIATITDKKTEFEMEIVIERGMGYSPTESREKDRVEVGAIAIDALFSPVVKVGYVVEDTRVGQITDFDKVTISIETDGTITPQQAVEDATKILMDHFSLLATADKESKKETK